MIDYNSTDFGIANIINAANLPEQVKYDYYFYGLKYKSKNRISPCIKINYNQDFQIEYLQLSSRILNTIDFLKTNGLVVYVKQQSDISPDRLEIGFRKDIRHCVELCAAITKTIVLSVEGTLPIMKRFCFRQKIPKLLSCSRGLYE